MSTMLIVALFVVVVTSLSRNRGSFDRHFGHVSGSRLRDRVTDAQEDLERRIAELEDHYDRRIGELEERVDFTERLLAKAREAEPRLPASSVELTH